MIKEEENLKLTREEREQHLLLQSKLKQEIEDCRMTKELLSKEREDLRELRENFEGNLMEFGWENLRNLITLDLFNTSLTGVIPDSISSLNTLRFLALDDNHLSGSVSPKFAALPCLCALYISGNKLTVKIEFSEGFYERLGRRFASWNNPNLCYNSRFVSTGHVPFGVEQCKHEQENSLYNSSTENKVDSRSSNQNSILSASFGFSASPINGFWWLTLVQEVVVALLLILLL